MFATVCDEFPSGEIWFQTQLVDAVDWSMPEGPFGEMFNTVATLLIGKYDRCLDSLCTAIAQKATIGTDQASWVVNLVDIETVLHAQNHENPESLYSELLFLLNRVDSIFENRVRIETLETLLRKHCHFPLFSWCDFPAALQFCKTQKEVTQTSISRTHPQMA